MKLLNYLFTLLISGGVVLLNACSEGDLSSLEEQLVIAKLNIQSIEISPVSATIPINETLQFKAIGNTPQGPIDITTNPDLKWSVSNTALANISASGLVTAFKLPGTIQVSIKLTTLSAITSNISISDAPLISLDAITDKNGATLTQISVCSKLQLKVMGNYDDGIVSFKSDATDKVVWNPAAEFRNSAVKGLLSVIEIGTNSIDVNATDGGQITSPTLTLNILDDLTSIDLNASTTQLTPNSKVQFYAYRNNGIEDISDIVTWQSTDEAVVTVDSKGVVNGLSTGSANINATCNGKPSNIIAVTVIPTNKLERIEINGKPDNEPKLFILTNTEPSVTFTANEYYADGTSKIIPNDAGITWNVRTIDETGVITRDINKDEKFLATKIGITEVYATYNGLEDDVVVRVDSVAP